MFRAGSLSAAEFGRSAVLLLAGRLEGQSSPAKKNNVDVKPSKIDPSTISAMLILDILVILIQVHDQHVDLGSTWQPLNKLQCN